MHPFNRHRATEPIEVRPRFRMTTTMSEEEVLNAVRHRLEEEEDVVGKVFWHHAIFRIPDEQRHYWSPELQFSVEANPQGGGTLVRCLIGPRQTVWALFLFLYAVPGLVMFFFGMNGFVQWYEKDDFSYLWVVPVCLLAIALVYFAAYMGRKKGHEQMIHLIRFTYRTMEEVGYERVAI
ncbi:MAG: hypothetical protein KDC12_03475 [Flavobacteriales bacterium]|nr:hypothetical protein [Flavobacteriales bacterium]